MEKTREERRAAFHSAMNSAMNLRALYRAMDQEDQVETVRRYPPPDRSLSGIFDAPLMKLFDLGEELGAAR